MLLVMTVTGQPLIDSLLLSFHASAAIGTLAYMFIFSVCFYKYIPSMLSRICFGLVLVLITVLTKVIIFNFEDSQSDMAYAGKLLYVSETLQGLSFTLVYPVSLEFTVAQSPVHIRGVMVGLWYTFWGIGSLFNTNTKFPFHCQSVHMY